MAIKNSPQKGSLKSIIFFILTSFLFAFKSITAQSKTDSTKKPLLASLDKTAGFHYITLNSNVIFPDILKGNETEMLPYIEKFSNKKRDYLLSMYNKGKNFLPKAAAILKNYKLPEELKILVTLESAYNGNAVSRAGAVGYWQIMDEMAGDYGMNYTAQLSTAERKRQLKLKGKKGEKKNKLVVKKDDRKNFNMATNAAARYLLDQSRNLANNWLLVVASYNCGAGNVRKAVKKSGVLNPTFWDIKNYLPAETRSYVMNFITLSVIFNNYEMFADHKLNFAPQTVLLADGFRNIAAETPTDFSDL